MRNGLYHITAAALLLVVITATGCAPQQALSDTNSASSQNEARSTASENEETPGKVNATQQPEQPTHELEISSDSEDGGSNPEDELTVEAPEESEEAQPAADDEQPSADLEIPEFSLANPRLMGVTISDTKALVLQRHGKPIQKSTMQDGDNSLAIYQYGGFMIGFNGQEMVEFVSVMSDTIDPGLNGFAIGQTSGEAVHALGPPSTETDYVLTYRGNHCILKLDVDPVTSEVLSVKLFPAE